MNFWSIFLCLAIGALVGYQFGKYMTTKRVKEHLDDAIHNLRIAAENLQKRKEQEEIRRQNVIRLMQEILPKMDPEDFKNKIGEIPEEGPKKDILKEQGVKTDGQGN
jgi:ribosomal protein L16 Arg81 hydroxylase